MKLYVLTATLIASGLLLGCNEQDTPTEAVTPTFSEAGNSVCYTVKFNVAGPMGTALTVTGDLEGSMTYAYDSESIRRPPDNQAGVGKIVQGTGTASWNITGGVIPGLGQFETELQQRNHLVDRPGSPRRVYELKGYHRAVSGVEKANLTYHGIALGNPDRLMNWDFQGVICP